MVCSLLITYPISGAGHNVRMKIGNGDKNRGKPNSDREKRVERLFLYELFVDAAIMPQKASGGGDGDEKS